MLLLITIPNINNLLVVFQALLFLDWSLPILSIRALLGSYTFSGIIYHHPPQRQHNLFLKIKIRLFPYVHNPPFSLCAKIRIFWIHSPLVANRPYTQNP